MGSNAFGCFKIVRGQEYVDFSIKCGMPKELAEKQLGSHWTMKMGQPEGQSNKWVWWLQCDECPEMNMLDSGIEGVEKEVDHPLCGGKAKILFEKAGPNTLKSTFKTEAYGEFKTLETFTDEGYHVETSVNGSTLKEFWTRYVNESGFFKFEKSENMEEYAKAQGFPSEMINAFSEMTMHQKICGNKFTMKESFGSMGTAVNSGTFDEECTYKWENMPEFNKKYVVTRLGPGKFKYVTKSANGRVEEIDATIREDGICYNMTDKMSGQCAKLWMKRYAPFEGKYKMIASAGLEEYGAAQDMPKGLMDKLQCEQPCMTIDCKDGMWHFKFESKIMPMENAFPLNKEFDFTNPINKKTNKLFCTVHGDTFKEVVKSDKGTVAVTMKFGETFVVQSSEILGLGIKSKVIFERIC